MVRSPAETPAVGVRFDDGFLKTLARLQIVSRRAFSGQNRADRLAHKRAHGLEFADHRAYVAGDDFRHIDWSASKRLSRLLLRLFDEEQDLPVYLFLDSSGSMAARGKFDQARRIAAALCYIGLAEYDRVTIAPFGSALDHEITTGRGKGRIFEIFEQLEALKPQGATSLIDTFKAFAGRRRPRGVTVVISDFLDPAGFERPLLMLSRLGHDVFVVHVTAGADRDCADLGDIRFVDAETGEWQDIELTSELAAAYLRAWDAHTADLETLCDRYRLAYVHADANQPIEDIILRTFRLGGFLA
jgi:uncharacterized protein (DUF58 family)